VAVAATTVSLHLLFCGSGGSDNQLVSKKAYAKSTQILAMKECAEGLLICVHLIEDMDWRWRFHHLACPGRRLFYCSLRGRNHLYRSYFQENACGPF